MLVSYVEYNTQPWFRGGEHSKIETRKFNAFEMSDISNLILMFEIYKKTTTKTE